MGNSPLINYTKLSPNYTKTRNHKIDTISIHCMAGNLSVESCGQMFQNKPMKASSNYGIGSDGRIGMYVQEKDRSWCTSSGANDNRAVTIEVANNGGAPSWPVSNAAYESLIRLVTDICKRNGISRLLWKADKSLIGQVDKQNMTVHRWFANKACPGDYLYARHADIANKVNANLGGDFDMYIEQIAKKAGVSTGVVVDSLAEYVRHRNVAEDAWEDAAVKKLRSTGIITSDHPGNAPVFWGELGVVITNAIDRFFRK